MDRHAAETLAAESLAWIAGQGDLVTVFLNASGAAPDDLRQLSSNAEFLASVLDFLLMDDDWVRAFCDEKALAYDLPLKARMALPGGQQVHWT